MSLLTDGISVVNGPDAVSYFLGFGPDRRQLAQDGGAIDLLMGAHPPNRAHGDSVERTRSGHLRAVPVSGTC